jgi:hypothetical protein
VRSQDKIETASKLPGALWWVPSFGPLLVRSSKLNLLFRRLICCYVLVEFAGHVLRVEHFWTLQVCLTYREVTRLVGQDMRRPEHMPKLRIRSAVNLLSHEMFRLTFHFSTRTRRWVAPANGCDSVLRLPFANRIKMRKRVNENQGLSLLLTS